MSLVCSGMGSEMVHVDPMSWRGLLQARRNLQLLWPRFYRFRVHKSDAAVRVVLKQFSSFCGRPVMDL